MDNMSSMEQFWEVTCYATLNKLPDFFLYIFLKERVYMNNTWILVDLKHTAGQAADSTDQQTLWNITYST
jgi:hypothetical protein